MRAPADQRKITILFAEDEEVVRTVFTRAFDLNGFHVLTAINGKQALDLAEHHAGNIDLLISNVRMPEMSGPDLARELRKSRPDLKIMLISGNPEEGLLLLDKGWVFLNKPVLPKDLIKKIENILQRPPSSEVDRGTESGFSEPK